MADQLLADDLLDPISPEQPCGANLRWEPEWDQIKEARRSDDNLPAGNWEKKEAKTADWRKTEKLATSILQSKSKDLQIAMWLAEAELKLHGFRGFGEGLRIVRELMIRYWDKGLHPLMEDGPADRAGPLAWLNEKLVDSVSQIPITRRSDQGDDYNYFQLQSARALGMESSYKNAEGEVDPAKKRAFDKWVSEGNVTLSMFQEAVQATDFELVRAEFERAYSEFKALEKVVDEKFGPDEAPISSASRDRLRELSQELAGFVDKQRKSKPTAVTSNDDESKNSIGWTPNPLNQLSSSQADASGSWAEAEKMVRSGKIDAGLATMAQLALAETTGRSRFQRKLLLAEICLSTKRTPLARTILEELAEQIDEFKLESWESSELVGAVWTRLHRIYKQPGNANADEAKKLFERLCHLDPWQALSCQE